MSSTGLSGWVKSVAIIVLCVVVAVIVRPVLQGLVLLVVNVALAAALLYVIYATLRRHGFRLSKADTAPSEGESETSSSPKTPEPPAQLSEPEPGRAPSKADGSADVEAELREIKRKLGRE